jgi:hypothetical protein
MQKGKECASIIKAEMIGVLATGNNLGVKNARQPVKRKDILHVSVRDTKQTNIDTRAMHEIFSQAIELFYHVLLD